MAAYVCMRPRSSADEATVKLRQRAYRQGVGSSHWPAPFSAIDAILPSARNITAQDERALQLAKEDEGHDTNGETMKALECWRKALNLSPRVEALLYSDGGDDGGDNNDNDNDDDWFSELPRTRRVLVGELCGSQLT